MYMQKKPHPIRLYKSRVSDEVRFNPAAGCSDAATYRNIGHWQVG